MPIITTNTATGHAFTFTNEVLTVMPGVFLTGTGGATGAFAVHVQALGAIAGTGQGIDIGVVGGALSTVYIGPQGSVTCGASFDAVHVNGPHTIENHGSIAAASGSGFGIETVGAGTTYNYGNISGGTGVRRTVGSSAGIAALYNFGVITATLAYVGSDNVDNVVNAGTITGQVNLGSAAGAIFDSSQGSVFGTIFAGSGGNTIIGGRNGGSILGSSGNDVLRGNASAEAAGTSVTLNGGGGSNALYGGAGNTRFIGGTSAAGQSTVMFGGTGTNVVDYSALTAQSVQVNLALHVGYVNNAPRDTLYGIEDVIGSAVSDSITGDALANRLTGGVGYDVLTGAGGADIFAYTNFLESTTQGTGGYDTIVDFQTGVDRLDLTALRTNSTHAQIFSGGSSTVLYTYNATSGNIELAVSLVGANAIAMSDIMF